MVKRVFPIICFLTFLLVMPSFSQDEITAEGFGEGMNQAEALMNAKRDAVEKGIGTILVSQTEIENFQLKRDQIITKTIGSVKSYEKISETKSSDGIFQIKIKAVLSKSGMSRDLASFHILLESMDKPKVMVIISENNVDNDSPTNHSAESAIIAFLKDPYDFDIVDPAVVAEIKASKEKMAKVAGDDAAAVAIASNYGAEVLIKGDAVARVAQGLSQNLGGMVSVQADVTLRAINCTTGRIIATGSGHGAKVHISPNTAGTNALSQAAKKSIKGLLDAIISDWNKQINNGIPIMLSIKGVKTFRDKKVAVMTLRGISGVSAVHERGWNGQSGLLEVDVQYKGNVDGFCSRADGYKMKQGGGSFLVSGMTGTRVSLVVQAK